MVNLSVPLLCQRLSFDVLNLWAEKSMSLVTVPSVVVRFPGYTGAGSQRRRHRETKTQTSARIVRRVMKILTTIQKTTEMMPETNHETTIQKTTENLMPETTSSI